MALLYTLTINVPEGIEEFPPAFNPHIENIIIPLQMTLPTIHIGHITKIVFADQTALMSYINAIKPTVDMLAIIKEWKTAYNISYIITVDELSASTITDFDWIN